MSDVLFNLHSIISSGLIPGGQSSSKRQTVFFMLVDPMDKSHKDPGVIDLKSTTSCTILAQCMEKTSRRSKMGSTSISLLRKDWNSIRLDRMQSIFKKHLQLVVFRKLSGWKLEKSFSKKFSCHLGLHQRSPWNTSGKENWVQNTLNDQKLGN